MGTDKKSAAVIFSLTLLELLLLHAFGWLQLFTGLLLVYVLPGLSLTLLLFHRNKLNLLEYAVSTIVLSLSLNILTILSSNLLLGVPITYATVTTQILAVSSCFLLGYLFLRFRSWDGSHALGLGVGGWQVIALTAALLFISYTTYMIHEDYMFPLHSDEWQDLARATSIIEHRNIVMRNPYLKEETHQFDLEIGFNLFLAEFFILTGVDPVLFYQYLPAITSLIAGLALFVFVYELFGDFYPAFLSTVFLAGLKGTIFLLGTWFMVAMSLSIPFIYFILYCLTRALKDNSLPFYLATSVSLLALTVIHPGMGSFLYLTVVLYLAGLLVYLLLKREIDFSFRKTCVCFAGVSVIFLLPLASFAYSLGLLWRDSLHETVRYFFTEFIVFGRLLQYDGVYEPLFLYEFYGPVASVLAVAGLFFFVYRGRGGVVSAALFLSLVNLVLYQFEGFNLFLFYERTVYFVLLYFVILSGAGLFSWVL
ncbi:MAG: hypothetical protein B6U72_04665 [Candidatus Altiarchaeales archaeon ex4484_2]|nr:MAG: hypothetical protein B6U72_04665 [Candidatus Altiarchaeales archaeon ex4484_2]